MTITFSKRNIKLNFVFFLFKKWLIIRPVTFFREITWINIHDFISNIYKCNLETLQPKNRYWLCNQLDYLTTLHIRLYYKQKQKARKISSLLQWKKHKKRNPQRKKLPPFQQFEINISIIITSLLDEKTLQDDTF